MANESKVIQIGTIDLHSQTAGALQKARSASDEAYLDTVRMINAFALVGTTKDLTKLISFLNAGIKRYKEQVMTRAKKKDDAAKGRNCYSSSSKLNVGNDIPYFTARKRRRQMSRNVNNDATSMATPVAMSAQ